MNTMLGSHTKVVVAVILALIVVLPLGYYTLRSAVAQEGPEPFLEMPDERYQECVRDTTYMRFNHWVLLKEIRDEFVREGTRGEIGLVSGSKNCRECHTSRVRFCDQCHNAVSLTPDCFDCHYYPDYPEESPVALGEAYRYQKESLSGQEHKLR